MYFSQLLDSITQFNSLIIFLMYPLSGCYRDKVLNTKQQNILKGRTLVAYPIEYNHASLLNLTVCIVWCFVHDMQTECIN